MTRLDRVDNRTVSPYMENHNKNNKKFAQVTINVEHKIIFK